MILVLACLLSAAVVPVWADGDGKSRSSREDGNDHDRVRRAVERGEILPLTDILKHTSKAYPGQLIEAELEVEDGEMIYELVIISEDGRVYKLYYDARNGDLLKVKGRDKRE